MAEIIFWICLSIIIYSYIGYTILLAVIVFVKKNIFNRKKLSTAEYLPEVTLIIAAYNEKPIIREKVENLRLLDYPAEKIKFVWVTDGSNDGSPVELLKYPDMIVFHESARKGKIGAINRAMKLVNSPVIVFCDANNLLEPKSIKALVAPFSNFRVGCVAGEKQIIKAKSDVAVGSGEGFYWKYESLIKRLESEVNSTIGAAGELFAIRSELFEEVEADTLLDDFVISLRIAQKGYQIKYAPHALAVETSSASLTDELKRKVRIAAGSIQTLPRLAALLNPFKFGFLSVQYWSHKVLRWTAVPVCMLILLPLNIYLAFHANLMVYQIALLFQLIFYAFAIAGLIFQNKPSPFRLFFVPYYLLFMNIALIMGFKKHLQGKQSVNWEKANRG